MTEEQLKKRAEEYAKKIEKELLEDYEPIEYGTTPYLATIPTPHNKQAFIDGYHECQKEHEWHYVKDGVYPTDDKKVLCILGDFENDNLEVGYYSQVEGDSKRWRFEDYDLPDDSEEDWGVSAWKEIVLPELPKEIK